METKRINGVLYTGTTMSNGKFLLEGRITHRPTAEIHATVLRMAGGSVTIVDPGTDGALILRLKIRPESLPKPQTGKSLSPTL